MDTKETTELVLALSRVLRDVAEHSDESKLKLLTSLLGDSGAILTGLMGSNNIPAEVKDLTEEEITELYQTVETELGDKLDPDVRSAIEATSTTAFAAAVAVSRWKVVIANRRAAQAAKDAQ